MNTKHDYNNFTNDFVDMDIFNDVLIMYPGMFLIEDSKLFCNNSEYCKGNLEILELEFRNLYLYCNKNDESVTITLDMTKQDGRLIQKTMNLSDEACLYLLERHITPCYSNVNSPNFVYYDMTAIQRRITIKNIIEDDRIKHIRTDGD